MENQFTSFTIKGKQNDIKLFDFMKLRSKNTFTLFLPLLITLVIFIGFTILLFVPMGEENKFNLWSYIFTYLAFALIFALEIFSLLMLPIRQKRNYEETGNNDVISIYEDRIIYSSLVKENEVENTKEISIHYKELKIAKEDKRNYYFVDNRYQGVIISKSNDLPVEYKEIFARLIQNKHA